MTITSALSRLYIALPVVAVGTFEEVDRVTYRLTISNPQPVKICKYLIRRLAREDFQICKTT